MDEDGDVSLPIPGGKWLTELSVGKHILNYDAMLVLTHFKGHTVGGFGGSLKNISIGCASGKLGKQQIHQLPGDGTWPGGPLFMERMVEGGKAITNHFGQHITYINVLRNMSVDCDCAGLGAAAPTTPGFGDHCLDGYSGRRSRLRWTWFMHCPKRSGATLWNALSPAVACANSST